MSERYTKNGFKSLTKGLAYDVNIPKGEVCGWHAFNMPFKPSGRDIPPPTHSERAAVGLSGDVYNIYVDSLDVNEWKRTIECGPGEPNNYKYCRLSTIYQQFPLTHIISPTNICRANEIEVKAKALLDKYLVAHHPPTRDWTDGSNRPWAEWTRNNINNPNIREDAR